MKKIITICMCLLMICSMSITAFAFDNSAGTGSTTINAHIYSSYTISIPATIDITGTYGQGAVTINDANLEEGYQVDVYVTNLTNESTVQLMHSDGTTKNGCSFYNTEKQLNVDSTTPLVTFYPADCTLATATKYFDIMFPGVGKAGAYSGVMNYSFSCTQTQE